MFGYQSKKAKRRIVNRCCTTCAKLKRMRRYEPDQNDASVSGRGRHGNRAKAGDVSVLNLAGGASRFKT
jgi:hypothetical protein